MGQAQNTPGVIFSGLVASASLAAKQYHLVKMASTAGQVIVAAAGTDAIIGVVQNDPAAGEAASIAVGGVLKVAGEASVSVGDWVTSSTTGRAKTTTTDGNIVLGTAIDATSAAGDIIRVATGLSALYVA
jgi:hypothetical protein